MNTSENQGTVNLSKASSRRQLRAPAIHSYNAEIIKKLTIKAKSGKENFSKQKLKLNQSQGSFLNENYNDENRYYKIFKKSGRSLNNLGMVSNLPKLKKKSKTPNNNDYIGKSDNQIFKAKRRCSQRRKEQQFLDKNATVGNMGRKAKSRPYIGRVVSKNRASVKKSTNYEFGNQAFLTQILQNDGLKNHQKQRFFNSNQHLKEYDKKRLTYNSDGKRGLTLVSTDPNIDENERKSNLKYISKMLNSGRNKSKEIQNVNIIRNISFLASKKPKKPRKRELTEKNFSFENLNFVKKSDEPRMNNPENLEDLTDLLEIGHFPVISNKLFDYIEKIGVIENGKAKLKEKNSVGENKSSHQRGNQLENKLNQYVLNYRSKGCADRDDHISLIKWFKQMKTAHFSQEEVYKENSNFENFVNKMKNFRNVLAFLASEIIDLEEKRCKETAYSIKTYYLENIKFYNILAEFFKTSLSTVNKRHSKETRLLKMEIQGMKERRKLEMRQNSEKFTIYEEEMKDMKYKTRVLRGKLVNDYIVMKYLRGDVAHLEYYVGVLKEENQKITDIIQDMSMDIKQLAPVPKPMQKITQRIGSLQDLSMKFTKEKKILEVERQDASKAAMSNKGMKEMEKTKLNESLGKAIT
jgi:hypothetical protein